MKHLILVPVALLLACGSEPTVPPVELGPSVWTWAGPVELSSSLTVGAVRLSLWEGEGASARIEESDIALVLWGTYTATEEAVLFEDGPDPFPLDDGTRPTPDEIHTTLHWKGHEVPLVLTRVPGAVP